MLLISRHFLTSNSLQVRKCRLLQHPPGEQSRVHSADRKPLPWQRIDWLKAIQSRPRDGKPLSGMSQHDADLCAFQPGRRNCRSRPASAIPHASRQAETPPRVAFFISRPALSIFSAAEGLAGAGSAWADGQHSHVVESGSRPAAWARVRWSSAGWRLCSGTVGAGHGGCTSELRPGASHDRQASDDDFLSAAFAWFGVKLDPATPPWDKGQRLAEAVAASRTLLAAGRRRAAAISRPARLAGRVARAGPQGAAGVPGQCGSAWPVPGHRPGAADGASPDPGATPAARAGAVLRRPAGRSRQA